MLGGNNSCLFTPQASVVIILAYFHYCLDVIKSAHLQFCLDGNNSGLSACLPDGNNF